MTELKTARKSAAKKKSGKSAKSRARPSKPAKTKPATPPESRAPASDMGASELPVEAFEKAADWQRWLERKHATARGIWVKFAKKKSGIRSIDRNDAVEGALCYGWIDGQGKSLGESHYVVKFTPRSPRSIWSKINRIKVLELIEQGRMKKAGLAEVERARRDGRWEAAYDSPRTAAVPEELEVALAANPRARAAFVALNAANRYAILWQLQTAKKAETRTRRIERFVAMLERGERLH